ncbi:hypothetical protein [Salinisphaera sp.]|uniref:hypothetical protein n=1 Tax=Salinisphaera sp. TaxID=1914330 RepID=UPI000C47C7AB|nr:hypothetical protein [Salinisphaera sp.]MAS09946.1 hypothetical protein [Salinisphaera sp.]|tara:strand:+ start:14275 stop:14523 length:249 start_codon:yes stop_codon:yes gene_type:complete
MIRVEISEIRKTNNVEARELANWIYRYICAVKDYAVDERRPKRPVRCFVSRVSHDALMRYAERKTGRPVDRVTYTGVDILPA